MGTLSAKPAPSWRLRDATPDDAEAIGDFACRTFRENFTHYDPQALEEFLPEHYGLKKFRTQLADPACRFWLVEAESEIIAYANVGDYKLPLATTLSPLIELHRLYVLKAWQGQRIGKTLMDKALAEAEKRKAHAMYLGVWEKNKRAQGFYTAYGFTKAGEYFYPPIGDIVDREWIMMKEF